MARYQYVLFFILFRITGKMASGFKNLSDQHLSEVPSIPEKIPVNTESLDLSHNNLSAVSSDNFEGLYKLSELVLDYNFLSIFPNLSSIAETLTWFQLSYNQLSIIPAQHLDILTKLEILLIVNNILTTIPDVAGPSNSLLVIVADQNNFKSFPALQELGKSLMWLDLRNNTVTETDAADLMLGKLEHLDIDGNHLKTIPVICGTQISEVNLTDNPLICDKGIAWLLTDGLTVSGTCDTPGHLKGLSVGSLSYSQLGITTGMCI